MFKNRAKNVEIKHFVQLYFNIYLLVGKKQFKVVEARHCLNKITE
jgi:hypothetical protein